LRIDAGSARQGLVMSGYFRMSADEWEPEHYKGRWSPESKAPRWWAFADASWYIDRRRLPAARTLAAEWGWSKSMAYDFAREVVMAQLEWEKRADERAYLLTLLPAPDKTRTPTVKSAGQAPDTEATTNAENAEAERTDDGQNQDKVRTDSGHLTGADLDPTSSTASTSTSTHTDAAPAAECVPTPPETNADAVAHPGKRDRRGAAGPRGEESPELAALWQRLVAFTASPAAWKLTPERAGHLRQRVAEFDVATVERVADWVRLSTHRQAVFLRERGDAKTLSRPENFANYAAMSAGWTSPPPAAPGRPVAAPDDVQRAWEWVCGFVRTATPGQRPAESTVPWQARARAALRRVPNGWQRVLTADDFNRRALREEFVSRWSETPASATPAQNGGPGSTEAAPRPTTAPVAPPERAERAPANAMREPGTPPQLRLMGAR
jgi:hypothetical protein